MSLNENTSDDTATNLSVSFFSLNPGLCLLNGFVWNPGNSSCRGYHLSGSQKAQGCSEKSRAWFPLRQHINSVKLTRQCPALPWRARILRTPYLRYSCSYRGDTGRLGDREKGKGTLWKLHHEWPQKSVSGRDTFLWKKEVRHRGFSKSEGLQKHS